jgi:hypothetical protein
LAKPIPAERIGRPCGASGQDNLCTLPVPANPLRERESIHGSRHFNVGEDDIDRDLGLLQHQESFIRIRRFNHLEPAIPQIFRNNHADEHFVFNKENSLRRGR